MPPTERKYAKQNLQRAVGHCEDIIAYLRTTGLAFFNKGEEVEQQTGKFPQEYLDIMANIDIYVQGQEIVMEGIKSIEASF